MAKIIWTPEEKAKRKEEIAKRKEKRKEQQRKERRLMTSWLRPKKLDACYEILNVPLGPNRRPLDATEVKRYFYKIVRECTGSTYEHNWFMNTR